MGGIVYANTFPIGITYVLLAVLILVLGWITATRKGLVPPGTTAHWRVVLFIAALLGAARMEALHLVWHQRANAIHTLSRMGEQSVSGTVEEIRVYENGLASLFLSGVRMEKWSRQRTFPGRIEIRGSASQLAPFQPGDGLKTVGRVVPIRGPSVPTSFNRQDYRYSQNIFGSIYIAKDTAVTRLPSQQWSRFRGLAYAAIARIRQALPSESRLPFMRDPVSRDEIAGLIGSMGYGIRSMMPAALSQGLQASGLAHITSISGLHVSLILFGVAYLLKQAGLTRKQAALFTAGLACLYVLIVGARLPTLRAALMAFVFLGSYFVQRRIDSLNSLAIAALLLLFLHPGELFLASFQLSFAAVLTLILFAPVQQKIWMMGYYPQILKRSLQGIITSVAVVVGLAPFTIAYFNIWSWGAIFGNLIAIPVVGFLLPVTYVWSASMLLPFPPLTDILGQLTEWLACFLILIIRFFSDREIFYIILSYPGVTFSVLMFLAFVLLCRPAVKLWGDGAVSIRSYHLALIAIAVLCWRNVLFTPWTPLRIDFLSLGQGDCTVVHTPGGQTVMIDGGPPRKTDSIRQPILVDYLRAQGISAIDAMVLTHPQSDHIGAMADVARHVPVSMLLEGTQEADTQYYKRFIQTMQTLHVPRKTVRTGDRIDLDHGVTLWVLSPDDSTIQKDCDVNEKSVVLLLQYQELDVLLTGDIGFVMEKELCDKYNRWDVDVLKVPHHGSQYAGSESFLQEIRPEFAVIPVGRNAYGHPHQEARDRLYAIGAHVLRTDYDGTIRLVSDGHDYRLYSTRSNRLYIFDLDRK